MFGPKIKKKNCLILSVSKVNNIDVSPFQIYITLLLILQKEIGVILHLYIFSIPPLP